jgi:hypothetical protein
VLIANDREQEEELKEMGLKDPKASIKKERQIHALWTSETFKFKQRYTDHKLGPRTNINKLILSKFTPLTTKEIWRK